MEYFNEKKNIYYMIRINVIIYFLLYILFFLSNGLIKNIILNS
jgi:hypothetical protein